MELLLGAFLAFFVSFHKEGFVPKLVEGLG